MDFVGTGKRLSAADYARAAKRISIPVATLRGVLDVEAAGSGFDFRRRPKILAEPHVFYRRLGPGAKRNRAVKLGVAYAKWGAKPYPPTSDLNYDRLAAMVEIDEAVALESASWGLPQIMGFNFKDAGFTSVRAMVESFKKGEGEQLDAFVALVDAWDLEDELQRRDAAGFARRYNGAGYAKNAYDRKLVAAWAARDRDKTPPATTEVPIDTRVPAKPPVAQPPVVVPVPAPVPKPRPRPPAPPAPPVTPAQGAIGAAIAAIGITIGAFWQQIRDWFTNLFGG